MNFWFVMVILMSFWFNQIYIFDLLYSSSIFLTCFCFKLSFQNHLFPPSSSNTSFNAWQDKGLINIKDLDKKGDLDWNFPLGLTSPINFFFFSFPQTVHFI